MAYGQFLQDFFSNLFVRNKSLGKNQDERQLIDLCKALLTAQGEVSIAKLAISILNKYKGSAAIVC